jgi:hypothetical protein
MDRIVTTTNGIYLWSSVTQIFHKSELSYDIANKECSEPRVPIG